MQELLSFLDGGSLLHLQDISLNYLFDPTCGHATRVDMRRQFSHEYNVGLSCGRHGCCLHGQPGINAGSDALSCAIVRDGLPVGKVKLAVDDGGTA